MNGWMQTDKQSAGYFLAVSEGDKRLEEKWPARDNLPPSGDEYADGDIAQPTPSSQQPTSMPIGFSGDVRNQVVPPEYR